MDWAVLGLLQGTGSGAVTQKVGALDKALHAGSRSLGAGSRQAP